MTGDVTVDDAIANDLGVAAEEGALDVRSDQKPPVNASAINPNIMPTSGAPPSETEEARATKRDPEARANPTNEERVLLTLDTSGAPEEEEEDEQAGVEELKGQRISCTQTSCAECRMSA